MVGLSTIEGEAIQAAAALRALVEIRYGEVRRGDPNGELELIAAPDDLNNINPEEKHLNTHPTEVFKPILWDVAFDGGLVCQLIGAFKWETAGAIQISWELSSTWIKFIASDPLGEEPNWKIILLEDLVGCKLLCHWEGSDPCAQEEEPDIKITH